MARDIHARRAGEGARSSRGMSSYGIDVERRRREIAAHHGVPDFVFKPVDIRTGSGTREIGDFLLWVGEAVAIVSSKSRAPGAAAIETQDRRRRWIEAEGADAHRQIVGTAKKLKAAAPGSIVLVSERGVEVPWDPTRIAGYGGVVLLDVPPPDDDYAPPPMLDGVPSVVMLGEDWDTINFLLPSTMAVIRHIGRRLAFMPRCPLGSELDVFALFVEHEQAGTPIELPPGGLPRGHFEDVMEAHPDWFLEGHSDDEFALVINDMIEGAADPDPEFSAATNPTNYLRILEFLDQIPLLHRVSIGKAVVERCQRVGRDGGRITAHFALPHGLLLVVADESPRRRRSEWLQGVTFARHTQALEAGAPASMVTVGVATEPLPAPNGRSHDYVVIQGPVRTDPEFLARIENTFGTKDMSQLIAGLENG